MIAMKKLTLLFTLFFLFGSCKKDYQLEKIDSDILVIADQQDSNIEIRCETEREYSCSNFEIINSEKTKNNEITVHFKKIKVSDLCLTSLGPASCAIDLGKLSDGEYSVTFELNNKKTNGKLKVGSTIELTLDSGGNVKPK
jgi:hypothetical protein